MTPRPSPLAIALTIALTATLQAAPALAQETLIEAGPDATGLPPEDGRTHWGLGLGVGMQRQPYTGVDDKVRALPLILFENRWVRVAGLGADLKLGSAGPVSFALRGRYAMDGYEASDAPVLNGMADRKSGFWVGGAALWRTGLGLASAEVLGDASGRSQGAQLKLGFDAPFRVGGGFMLTPHASAVWLDRKFVDYYFGVRPDEVREGRVAYDGQSTVNTELGLRIGYAVAPNQLVSLDVGSTLYGKGIKDSPLVDRGSQASVRAAYIYRF